VGRVAAIVLWMAVCATVVAEEPPAAVEPATSETLAARLTAGLAVDLQLDEEQLPPVEDAMRREMQRKIEILRAWWDEADPTELDEAREELRTEQQRTRERLEPVLSPQQLAGLEAAQAAQLQRIGGEMLVRRLTPRLGLTEMQQEQLVPIFAADLERRRDLLREFEKRQGRRGVTEMHKRNLVLQEELELQLAPLLDELQMAGYHEALADRRAGAKSRVRQRTTRQP